MNEILFLYFWILFVPAFNPCSDNSCFAIPGREAYNDQKVEYFTTYEEAVAWITKNGKPGRLVNVQTRETTQFKVKPVLITVEEVVKKEVIAGYEIEKQKEIESITATTPLRALTASDSIVIRP